MGRIRTIKPEFFRHADLYDAERETGLPLRLAFAGLWTAADKSGRFKWKPRELKLDCLPHDDVDFSRVLDALTTRGWLVRYAVQGVEYGAIPTWETHQVINNRETPSKLPAPNENNTLTREARVPDATATPHKGKGREGEREGEENSEANASGADAPPDPAIPEREYFERGRKVLGPKAGAMIANLLKAKGRNVALARAALEEASQKQKPMEYVAAICRGPPPVKATTVYQQRQAEGREILNEIDQSIARRSGPDDFIALRHDPGDGRALVRGGSGSDVIDIPAKCDRFGR